MREFLASGVECVEIDPRSYKERIEVSRKYFLDSLRKAFPDKNEYEEMASRLYGFVGAVEDVYMEIGLQAGFRLAVQLLQNPSNPDEKKGKAD